MSSRRSQQSEMIAWQLATVIRMRREALTFLRLGKTERAAEMAEITGMQIAMTYVLDAPYDMDLAEEFIARAPLMQRRNDNQEW